MLKTVGAERNPPHWALHFESIPQLPCKRSSKEKCPARSQWRQIPDLRRATRTTVEKHSGEFRARPPRLRGRFDQQTRHLLVPRPREKGPGIRPGDSHRCRLDSCSEDENREGTASRVGGDYLKGGQEDFVAGMRLRRLLQAGALCLARNRLSIHQLILDGITREFRVGLHHHFFEHPRPVCAYGLHTKRELFRNLADRVAGADHPKYLVFPV
jgi:hypothetical protein